MSLGDVYIHLVGDLRRLEVRKAVRSTLRAREREHRYRLARSDLFGMALVVLPHASKSGPVNRSPAVEARTLSLGSHGWQYAGDSLGGLSHYVAPLGGRR